MAFEGLSNTAGGRGVGASDSLRDKKNEAPTPIADDVRARWAETRMRDGDFILTDKDGTELARVPFSDANFNHYMGGPLENAARVESGQLAILNEQRRALGKPELTSLAQIEEEEKAFRRNRRGPAARDDVPYNNKVRERIQENIRTTFRDLNVGDDVLQQLEQAVGKVTNHTSARKLADFIATLPRKPGVPPAGGRPMAQRPKIASHEGDARHLTPDEITALARVRTAPAGDDRRGAEYDKKMTPYTAEELAEAKKNLRKTLGKILADGLDERRSDELNKKLKDSTTPDSIRALAAELRGIEDARVKALGRKIDERRDNAPGLFSNGAGAEFIEQNGNLYIREGKAIRLATEKEKTERAARLQAAAAGGPTDAPSAAGAGEVVQGANGTIDLGRLGAQAQANVRSRERPTGPRIRQAQPLNAADVVARGSVPQGDEYLNSDLLHAAGGGHERPGSWATHREDYIGIPIKRIPDILSSPREQQFFGEILRAIAPDKGDVLLRYRDGTASQEDMDFITYGSYEYSKWMFEGEKVAAKVTAQDMELMARRNPDMRNMIAHVSAGREVTMMKDMILHLAMKNPRKLQEVADAFDDLGRARDTRRFKHNEERIAAQCERVGLKKNHHGAMFNLKNPTERKRTEARLAEHIHKQAGGFRRAIDWVGNLTRTTLPGSSRYKAVLETMEASRITPHQRSIVSPTSWVLDTINTRLHTITEHLSETVADPEVRTALMHEALSNQPQAFASARGPRSFAEVQAKASNEFSQQALKQTIQARINSIPNFASRPPREQDAILNDVRRTESEKQGSGRGFFAWLASLLFNTEFNKAASAATGRPVHA